MEDGLVKNTLAFRFPPGAPSPSLVEVAQFNKNLNADLDSMETSYKMSEERCVCVKFKSLEAMKEAQSQIPEICAFRYSNNEKVEVKMTVAGCCTRYVRIFDLPPEVPDSEIAAVLGRYGVVKRMVREKFPADLGLDMFTGIRGVYVDLKKAIPASLYFLNRKGRIFYEGLKQKCYLCKEEGHLKTDCPLKAGGKAPGGKYGQENNMAVAVESKDNSSSMKQAVGGGENTHASNLSLVSNQPSYSGVVSGNKVEKKENEPLVPNMVKLVSARNKSPALDSAKDQGHSVESMETDGAGSGGVVDEAGNGGVVDGAGKGGVKRQHSAGESVGDNEEELPGFTKVKGNQRLSRLAKKAGTPLETISKESLMVANNRSSSK